MSHAITSKRPRTIKKSLTKSEYTKLLWIIGKSKQPLSSTQIEKEFGSKYVHEMLKLLCPSKYTKSKPLFIWEDIKKIKMMKDINLNL